ncbi:2-phospho-L-lactate transferase [Paenibacillus sp. TRM 82003]|nr:2-phospho-L-lactate transferase [Kineococcus sp. TRM81007]MCI2237868.1 2-phospho-L-lactate transferase [Kineococcus sp. TRM81007]MCI3924599.1 2-phospho-L-lactate transferase [Paenibacillus sp. TRM 82003]
MSSTTPVSTPARAPGAAPLRVTALAGGVGGARFLRGLLAALRSSPDPVRRRAQLTVVVNTADDVTLHGLRISPDLDSVMYTLGGGIDEGRGWGRDDETYAVAGELARHGQSPTWFTLGDKDIATHVVRTRLLAEGRTLSEATEQLCRRWEPGARLLPMTDDVVETHVDLAPVPEAERAAHDGEAGGRRVHFQEWWVRLHAAVPALAIEPVGAAAASPAPGVLEALRDADVVVLPPSNPVVSIGSILAVPGIRDALVATAAPVVGVSPVIGGAPVRGMADACLAAIGVPTTAAAVAGLYADLLDGWLIAEGDEAPAPGPRPLAVRRRPLLMSDPAATAALAGAAVDLALELTGEVVPA